MSVMRSSHADSLVNVIHQHINSCNLKLIMIFANAASMMRDEHPKVNKCCVPLPLKLCLEAWSYTKIVTGLLIIVTSTLPVYLNGFYRHVFYDASTYPLIGVIVVLLTVDIGFQISSIVGVHKKSYNTLRVLYYYEVFAITVDIILTPVVLYMTNTEHTNVDTMKTIIILVIGLFYISVDICTIIEVKREITKIHHKYELSSLQD